MKSIPDEDFNGYTVSLSELSKKNYKQRVNLENRNHNYSKFAISREECNIVIKQNIDKAWNIFGMKKSQSEEFNTPDLVEVLKNQLSKLELEKAISVLCTCAFYIVDYNPKFII